MSTGLETGALAVYGSLQPGGPNEHVLARLGGEWSDGYVLGSLDEKGWGAKVGFPGIRLSDTGYRIPVKVLTSQNLSEFWGELDAPWRRSMAQSMLLFINSQVGNKSPRWVWGFSGVRVPNVDPR